jgi:SHS2 domain-containing protein
MDHTADAGFVLRAPEAAEACARAVLALRWLQFGNDPIEAEQCRKVRVEGVDRAERLLALLQEVLFLLEVEHFVTARAEVRIDGEGPGALEAELWGQRIGQQHLRHEVKAVTYHRLFFGEVQGEVVVRVVFDL